MLQAEVRKVSNSPINFPKIYYTGKGKKVKAWLKFDLTIGKTKGIMIIRINGKSEGLIK